MAEAIFVVIDESRPPNVYFIEIEKDGGESIKIGERLPGPNGLTFIKITKTDIENVLENQKETEMSHSRDDRLDEQAHEEQQSMKIKRVMRIIIIEGVPEWVDNTIKKSLLGKEGKVDLGAPNCIACTFKRETYHDEDDDGLLVKTPSLSSKITIDKGGEKMVPIDLNILARDVSILEGGAKEVNIDQVRGVISATFECLRLFSDEQIIEAIRREGRGK